MGIKYWQLLSYLLVNYEKIDGKLHRKFYKNASRGMPSLSDLFAMGTTLAFLLEILQMNSDRCIEFVNGVDPDELANALHTHGANSFFVFSLAIIYIRAGVTRAFPQRLVELIYDAVFNQVEGTQEFLTGLNQMFREKKNNVVRSLWGLCVDATSNDLESFLKVRNSSPLIRFYWLNLAVRGKKQIVKELFQILQQIAQQNIKPNPKVNYDDVVNVLLNNHEYFLFHESNGVFAVILEKGSFGNILNLFEIQWNFTLDQLSHVQKFLKKHPINASWLIEKSHMSDGCSRFLIGTVMNFAHLLDPSGWLIEATLLLPQNFERIGEFVHLSYHDHLKYIFCKNQVLFDTHVTPQRYGISNFLYFFMNLHMRGNSNLFSNMIVALKTYGNKLLPEDLNAMKTALTHFDVSRQMEAAIFAAFMCIDRPESIPCLKDYIALLKAILNRKGAHTLQVAGCDPTKLQEIVCAFRSVFPIFVLNVQILLVNDISLLPVVNLHATSQPVITFLQVNAQKGSFPCMLQLMMTSRDLDSFIDAMRTVMAFIIVQVNRDGPNDVQYQLNLAEMFHILHAWFCKFDIKMHDFNNRISGLFDNQNILDAFVADPRFAKLTRGLRNDRRIVEMRQKCQAHCTQHKTTMIEAQRALGFVVFDCSICTELSTSEFTTIFQCGHCLCTSCAEQISNCSTCRKKITYMTQADSLGIRFQPDPAPQASGHPAEEPAQKMQRQEK